MEDAVRELQAAVERLEEAKLALVNKMNEYSFNYNTSEIAKLTGCSTTAVFDMRCKRTQSLRISTLLRLAMGFMRIREECKI